MHCWNRNECYFVPELLGSTLNCHDPDGRQKESKGPRELWIPTLVDIPYFHYLSRDSETFRSHVDHRYFGDVVAHCRGGFECHLLWRGHILLGTGSLLIPIPR